MTASGRADCLDLSPGVDNADRAPARFDPERHPTVRSHRKPYPIFVSVAALVFGVGMATGATIYLVTHTSEPTSAAAAEQPRRSPDPVVVEAPDPYEAYLANNPDRQLVLSREDAQARAYLGCGKRWAPGTIDRALADAYRPTGICD